MDGQIDLGTRRSRTFARVLILSFVVAFLQIISSPPVLLASPLAPVSDSQVASVTLDNVVLSIQTPFALPSGFAVSEPGNAIQSADSSGLNPFRDFQIIAIPFGMRTPVEGLPLSVAGGTSRFEAELRSYRESQGARSLPGPAASLFGQAVSGQANLLRLRTDARDESQPLLLVEWVVEAGKRLWLVRVAVQMPDGEEEINQSSVFLSSLKRLVITGTGIDRPSTLTADVPPPAPPSPEKGEPLPVRGPLAFPPWWNGDCDLNYYKNAPENPNHIPSFDLGKNAVGGVGALGIQACGPRPWADGGPDVLVRFFPGAWGEYEWECVELSMRFMYLAYGVPPYSANGKDVVPNCSKNDPCRQKLDTIADGTPNRPPLRGDIISFCSTCQYGHTVVVTYSKVDGNGNGSIRIVEQNAAAGGVNTLQVAGWSVKSSYGATVGWLHPR